MFEQLILHAIGDYLLQNDWMAKNKSKLTHEGDAACIAHVALYSAPFLLIGSAKAFIAICISHYLIDRFRLATYWIKLVNWNWDSNNFGYDENKPRWMSTWLLIIVDNTFHISCNYLALKYL